MALCAYLRWGTRQLLLWSSGPLDLWDSGTLGRGSQGRVSGKGDQGGLGGLERLPGGVC